MIADVVDLLMVALIVAGCLYVICEWCWDVEDAERDDESWST